MGVYVNSREITNPFQNIRNISSNLVVVLLNMLISLWYTPFLVRGLGSELFGFIPLATSVTNFLGIITLSLNTTSGRFLTIELGKNNTSRANQIFNTTLVGSLFLISFTIPFALGLVILIPNLFNVPVEITTVVQFLFIGNITAFYLTTLRSNFLVASFAKNRFDLRNIIDMAARLGQIILIVLLFYFYSPKLVHIGIGVVVSGIIGLIGNYSLWKKLLPALRLNFRAFKKQLLRPLMGTSLWVFIFQIGSTLFMSTDMLVANRILDLRTAGMFGALLVIPKNLQIIARSVGSVWGPTILTKFSRSDLDGMDNVVLYTVKLIGFTIALPVGLIVGLAKPFLTIWLGPEFEIMTWILVVMVLHLSVNLVSAPFLNIQVTLNKMALPAVFNLVLGAAYYLLAVVFSRLIGPMGIVTAGALTLTVDNFIVMPVYTARIMGRKWWYYLQRLFPIIVATLVVAIPAYITTLIFPITLLISLLLIGAIVTCIYLPLTYRIGLSGEEREMVVNILVKIISGIPGLNRFGRRDDPLD